MSKKQQGDAQKIHFYANKDKHIRFKVALEKHNMTMSEFFRACCDAIIGDEEEMNSFLESYKLKSKKHSKRNMKILRKDAEQSENILADLGINEDDIESLFDFIADQHPEI